jgi:tetrapyrrole methylase family protein / MazG family protein
MHMKKTSFEDLVQVMTTLRAPGGCPWDREQTHASLMRYLKEESEEVAEAVKNNDMENLEEELGDILLQILFHADIAKEAGHFDINDVLHTLKQKLVNRHPHVFGDEKGEKLTPQDVKNRWNELKAADKEKRRAERARRSHR